MKVNSYNHVKSDNFGSGLDPTVDPAPPSPPALPLDLSVVPTPCYVCSEEALTRNLRILDSVRTQSGCRILLALKGFAMWRLFEQVGAVLDGAGASSLHEARLASEEMGGELHVCAPAYSESDIKALLQIADHLVFNSFSQWVRFRARVRAADRPIACGIRINPEQSEAPTPIYDPCSARSRFGVTAAEFQPDELDGISGFHFHALCEQGADSLVRVLEAVESKFGQWLPQLDWVNFGGGHSITRPGYALDVLVDAINRFRARYGVQVYIEPGEAVAWDTGPLVASVLDIVHNDMDIAILDTSAAAHMPDCLEMPYRPDIAGAANPTEHPHVYRLAGNTCLAGDVIGDYSFPHPLTVGAKLAFENMIHYTMVKNNTFNGMNLPSIAIWTKAGDLRIVRRFGYEDYKGRLS